MATLGVKGLTD